MPNSNTHTPGGLPATLNGITLPSKGRVSKSYYGIIHTDKKHHCLYIGGGYFLTCYMPEKGCDTILFEDDLHPYVTYVPVFGATKDCVTVIYASSLANVRSFVKLSDEVPDKLTYNKTKLFFPKMRPSTNPGFRNDIKECDYWREHYGVEKYQMPFDKKFNWNRFQTEIVRNGSTFGVIAYHKKQKHTPGNRYGGVRVFTPQTLTCEYYLKLR